MCQLANERLEEGHLVELLVPKHADLFCLLAASSLVVGIRSEAELGEVVVRLHEALTRWCGGDIETYRGLIGLLQMDRLEVSLYKEEVVLEQE